jgi:hypothetical protein
MGQYFIHVLFWGAPTLDTPPPPIFSLSRILLLVFYLDVGELAEVAPPELWLPLMDVVDDGFFN